MRVECRNLRFNLEKERDRKAKKTLLTVPNGQQNQFILNAICVHTANSRKRRPGRSSLHSG